MIIDGKKLAAKLEKELVPEMHGRKLTLAVISVGSDPVSLRYINKKKQIGERLGITVIVHVFDAAISEENLATEVMRISEDRTVNGMIVQLPLPKHIATERITARIPSEKDADALGLYPRVLPPVVLAVREICREENISLHGKHIVIVGKGKLVGKPVAEWVRKEGAFVEIVDRSTKEPDEIFKKADIIVSGAGVPSLITPDKIKEGVILFDAATSEMSGKLVGDIDPACADKAAFYTPVPGGIGPLTVVLLFKNLIELTHGD